MNASFCRETTNGFSRTAHNSISHNIHAFCWTAASSSTTITFAWGVLKNRRYARWTWTTDFVWCQNSTIFVLSNRVNCGIFPELFLNFRVPEMRKIPLLHSKSISWYSFFGLLLGTFFWDTLYILNWYFHKL